MSAELSVLRKNKGCHDYLYDRPPPGTPGGVSSAGETRPTRLSNGFSRKLENHAAATALNYFAYNFIKIHRTLRTSPAMAAGVTDRLWSVEDLVTLWEAYEQRRAERAA
jgi:hypothetical protein